MKRKVLSLILIITAFFASVSTIYAEENAEYGKVYFIEDYTDGAEQSWGGAYNASFNYNSDGGFYEIDSETTLNGADYSVRWNSLDKTTTAGGSSRTRWGFFARTRSTLNGTTAKSKVLSEYNYVNMWMYSHKATSQPLQVRIYYDKSTSTDLNPDNISAGNHYLKSDSITVDWIGWKLVSVKISSMTDNMTAKNGKYSWSNGDMAVNSTGVQVPNQNDLTTCGEIDVNIDSIWYSVDLPTEFDFTSASSEYANNLQGAADVPVTEDEFTLSFNRELNTISVENFVEVYAGNEKLEYDTDYDVLVSKNNLSVKFNDLLLPTTEYKIIVKDLLSSERVALDETQTVTFTTGRKECYVSNIDFYDGENKLTALPASGTVTVKASVFNLTDDDKDVVLIAAEYDKTTNRMLSVKIINEKIDANVQKTISAELESEDFSNSILEAFVADNLTNLYNMSDAVVLTGREA